MIKHETTLEEAKQIKELGFDFSNACEKFYFETEEKYYPTPIIPYPILEACLIKNTAQWDRLVKNPRTGKLYAKVQGEPGHYKPNKDYNIFHDCFKAFIWCAEFYPKETKEQFDKIMELYK